MCNIGIIGAKDMLNLFYVFLFALKFVFALRNYGYSFIMFSETWVTFFRHLRNHGSKFLTKMARPLPKFGLLYQPSIYFTNLVNVHVSQCGSLKVYFLFQSESKQQILTVDASDKVTQAMRVLEIQEKLERGSTSSNGSEEPLTEPEVAILKQMCNVSSFLIFRVSLVL